MPGAVGRSVWLHRCIESMAHFGCEFDIVVRLLLETIAVVVKMWSGGGLRTCTTSNSSSCHQSHFKTPTFSNFPPFSPSLCALRGMFPCCHQTVPRSRTRRLQAWPPASRPRPCSLMQMASRPRHQIKTTRSTSCARLPLASFRPPPGFGHCHAGTGTETLELPPLRPSPRNHSCRSKRRDLLAVD